MLYIYIYIPDSYMVGASEQNSVVVNLTYTKGNVL